MEKLFGWGREVTQRVVKRLLDGGQILSGVRLENQAGEWLALSELV